MVFIRIIWILFNYFLDTVYVYNICKIHILKYLKPTIRTLFKILLFSLLLLQYKKSYSQWQTIDIVDDTRDKVSETTAYIGKGYFSNTASSRSNLLIRLTLGDKKYGENYLSFDFYKSMMEKIYADSKKSVKKTRRVTNRIPKG